MQPLLDQPALLGGLAAITLVFGFIVYRDLRHRLLGPDAPRKPVQRQYRDTSITLWLLCIICFICWILAGQPLSAIGLQATSGWTGWLVWGLVAVSIAYALYALLGTALDREARIKLRRDFYTADGFDLIRPRTVGDHAGFQFLSLTAGITEEVIFRGFLIATLALVMPVWAAALASMAVFILAHAYQGLSGMLRITPITLFMTAVVLIGGSLWPAMIIHILADALAGALVALVDAHEDADACVPTSEAEALPA
ncbi:CPBP family intramembrane glutamic endopeptidase [Maricaulis maris]|uniref:CAAX prenyl protease-like protein n=1 Tax=Maricaulis maris TaxID=74318 RepID=A0A495CZC1_9PROT|nr:CPBP family intramembrane glutamic endopeptidase [Maricaulis maris]RKQ89562.1 CAAX prenyl protease-like protein [Maricaulis maris]